jgi:cytochrome c5
MLGIALAVGTARAEDWQKKAVEMYPQLGVADSAFAKKFQQLRRQQELVNPDYFNNPQWPVLLAKECAAQLAAETKPKAPSSAAPAAVTASKTPSAPAMTIGEKLYQAKCIRCHDLPDPGRVEQMTWNRWMMSMRYKAGLNDEEYDQLMDHAQSRRDAWQAKKAQ